MELPGALELLPAEPGVYRFSNADGETIYVGKAKSLRQRVRSYFRPGAQHQPDKARMVAEARAVDVIVVNTEMEALLLESNLIKRQRPRYNVVLRDDKQYPYVKLSVRDDWPRASLVRKAKLDGELYVGPFLPASGARRTLKILQRDLRIPTCREVFDGKRRPCLYYHLDQCLAPCAGKTDAEEYGAAIEDARLFLDGRHGELEASLEAKMREASETQAYERAMRYRDTLKTLRALAVRQRISSAGLEEQDFLAHHAEGEQAVLEVFVMRGGRVQARREFGLDGVRLEPATFYADALLQYYAESVPPPEIYLPAMPDDAALVESWLGERRGGRVRLRVPKRGPKRRFLELVERNAALAFESRYRAPQTEGVRQLDALAEALGLDEPPFRVECFDISNIHGTDSVASMVVWEGGKPKTADFRSFTIRDVEGADDFASIAEAVTRRYRRLLAEDRRLPDLVLIDGGRGQLGAAVAALARVGLPMLPVASIAKREEEIFVAGRDEPVRLDRRSPALQLVQRIRDEAHRFAVTRHRRKRTRRTLRTELTELPGIGEVRARALLREFGSLAGVRKADTDALIRVAGRTAAEAIRERWGPPEQA